MGRQVKALQCAFRGEGWEGDVEPPSAAQMPVRRREEAAALDELFAGARRYRTTREYMELVRFIARFRAYSPFNAMLVHAQKKGASYVAPASRWWRDYRRRILPGANPLVILQPMGPVMFVFDVSDTEPVQGAPPLPPEVERPFQIERGSLRGELEQTVENARRDGVRVVLSQLGSQGAGWIEPPAPGGSQPVVTRVRPYVEHVTVLVRYELILNSSHSRETRYATLAHELGHLYCGHVGTPSERWWPDRRGLSQRDREFEAESVSYIICRRLGLDTPAAAYLGGYVREREQMPCISLDSVVKAAGLIREMGRGRLPLRKEGSG